MLWVVGVGLVLAWLILKFGLQQTGFVNLLLLSGLSLLVVQLAAERRNRFRRRSSDK